MSAGAPQGLALVARRVPGGASSCAAARCANAAAALATQGDGAAVPISHREAVEPLWATRATRAT